MELWIRSQDKKKLVKVDELKMETVKDGNTFIYSHATDLGTYETKERALEVLNEIQSIIRGKFATFIDTKLSLKSFEPKEIQNLLEQMAVYEMPEK